jgi:hypothetical protein
MAAWSVLVDFGAGDVEIGTYCHDLTKTQRLHNDLRSTVNTCAFTVSDETVANSFLTSDDFCPVTITKDAAAWFTGLVRPTFSAQVDAGLAGLGVECVDNGILLQKTVETPVYYAGYKVCDTVTPAASILHQLFYAAGFAAGDLSLTTINKTIAYYAIDPADKTTYWDVISQLCFEYGYVFYCRDDGLFTLVDLFPTAYASPALVDDDIYHGLQVQKQERQYEAARVEWHPQRSLSNQLVFEDTTGSDGKTPCHIDVAALDYYPDGSHTDPTYCEYVLTDYEIIRVSGAALKLSANGVSTHTFTAGYKRAQLCLYSAQGGTITKLRIRGTAIVRDLCTIKRSVRYAVVGTEKILDIQALWIAAGADAKRLSNGVARWFEFADYTYTFPTDEALSPGDFRELTEAEVLGITTDIRVLEVTEDENAERQVTAEGMGEYAVLDDTIQDSVQGGTGA